MTESAEPAPSVAEAAIARSKAKRATAQQPPRAVRTKPAKGGRFLATGAAVGLSLAAVGAMSAATQAGDSAPAESSVQRVVLSQPTQTPQQIVIVLPGADPDAASALVTQRAAPVTAQSVEITAPAKPTPPAPAEAAPAPVTESGGS